MSHRSIPRTRTIVRHILLGGCLFGSGALLPLSTVSAQQPTTTSAAGTAEELETVMVTGSYIRRADLESTVPLTVIDQAAIETRNALLPSDLLMSLPSVVNLPENESRLGSSGARGDNANINMRNMGATATLILVNGRRMAVNPMTAGLSQAVNVNQLPTQGIERIEVLRDGASSIYGSDAVGGVINYVLKREFDGIEAGLRYGLTEEGGGQNLQATLTFGSSFAAGRGRFFGTLEALQRDEIRLTQRDFSDSAFNSDRAPPPFNQPGGPYDTRSARGYWPTFRVGTSTATNYFRPVSGTPTLTTAAPSRATNPEFFLDLNQFGFASPEVKRGNAFLSAEFDFTDTVTAFADFSYYLADSTMRRQPLALNAPTSDKLMVMPVDSPYNPYGSRFYSTTGAPNTDGSARLVGTPRTVSFTAMTLPGLAAETVTTNADVSRIAAGLRGKLGETWEWESSVFYNEVNGEDDAYPDVRESKLQSAIGRTDTNAYNPFGYTFRVAGNAVVADQPYTNPAAVVDSFSEVYSRSATSSIASVDARLTGRLFELWGSEVMAAFGTEYRKEKLSDIRPPFSGENPADSGLDPTNNDFLLHPPRPDVIGERDVTSVYAELVVPLVSRDREIPLVRSLEVTASARYEDYSDFGTTTKPKAGINWRPVSWLMLRGSYNEGFMAPSLAALYTSPRWSITAGAGDIDAYRNPFLNEGPYVKRTYFGGNPDLKAQESEGTTYGFVLDVPGVRGLSLTADLWKITRTNLLGSRNTAQIDASDQALLIAYTKAQLAAGVPIAQIDLGSGTAGYRGDPNVERFVLTPEDRAAFAAYNAANPSNPAAPVGRIFARYQPFLNLSSSDHRGVDFGVRYALSDEGYGSFVFSSEWSYLDRSTSVLAPANVAPTINDGLYAGGAAKWRSTTNINWQQGGWNAGLGIYYVGETHDSGATTTQPVYDSLGQPSYIAPFFTGGRTIYRRVIDPVVSYNLSVGYRFGESAPGWIRDTRVRLGIVNLTNEEPPLSASGSDNFGYDPSVSQSLLTGRSWSLELVKKF
jgi:outer membrane receptor protein involved in Fe transport